MSDSKAPEVSPMIKDGKRLPLSRPLVPFLVTTFVVLPLLLGVVLPLFLVFGVGSIIIRKLSKKTPPKYAKLEKPLEVKPSDIKPFASRKYDLVMFGATGFTGHLSVNYIAKQYKGKGLKWAMAGRRRGALEKIRDELAAIDPALKDMDLLIADVFKPDTLGPIVSDTRCVVTTVGPFIRYGTPLVEYCANYGTSYCDITGEADWCRTLVDKYDETAKKTGARIVNMCGHDCVPWDLCVMAVADRLRAEGQEIRKVEIGDYVRASPSGGTLETIVEILTNPPSRKNTMGYDPFMKGKDGNKSEFKTVSAFRTMFGYSSRFSSWAGPFLMAAANAVCVKRSNAYNAYSKKLVYAEEQLYPSFMAGFVSTVSLISFGLIMLTPPLRFLMRKFVLPSPGSGPSEKAMDANFLQVSCTGIGSEGKELTSHLYFPTDPGYRDTARMLVESGLSLALESDQIEVGGGIHTPATCLRYVLLKRLQDTGSTYWEE